MSLKDKQYLQINQALFSLTHSYSTRMAKETVENGDLSLADCSVLMIMYQFSPTQVVHLSRIMEINPGTISQYIQRLVGKGLVQRERDQNDRRNWWLRLTPEGRKAAGEVVKRAIQYTRDFFTTLDEGEQKVLHQALLKASHHLGFTWQ